MITSIKNILVTGHKGYIGSHLIETLSQHNVFGIDLKDNENLLTCEFPQDIDLVIHLAGKSGVRESIKDPTSYWMNNIEASKRLFERYKNTRIIYASSSSAYQPELNPYASSKFTLEMLASKYSNTLGLRIHTVYSDKPRSGMFLDKLLNNNLEYVTNHQRDFIHVNDVCDAINILITKPKTTGIIDIGTGKPIRICDLAPNLPIRLNTPYERSITCANTETMKFLGFKPKYNIENFLTNKNKGTIINLTNGEPA